MFYRVEAKFLPYGATDCDVIIWESFFALGILAAQQKLIVVLTRLWPFDEVAIAIINGVFLRAAELVLLAHELIGSEDGEDAEDEDNEEEDAHQAGNRAQKRLDLKPHSRHLIDRA